MGTCHFARNCAGNLSAGKDKVEAHLDSASGGAVSLDSPEHLAIVIILMYWGSQYCFKVRERGTISNEKRGKETNKTVTILS